MSQFTEKLSLLFTIDNEDFQKGMGQTLAQMEILRMSVQDMTAPIENLSAEMVQLSSDYESSLANVNTLLNDSGELINRYKQQIIDMSKKVPQSATELADGLYQVISAGVDAADAVEFLGVASKAAVGGMSDTYTAVDSLTTILNSYNLQASEAQRVSDQMFETVKLGKVTYGELASQMGMLAPMAAQAGVSITEMLAAVATTSKKLKPEQTFTGLSQAIMQIMTPASKADKAFQKLGFESGKAAIKSMGLQGALLKLKESGANLFDVFDTRSAKAVMALTASSEVARSDLEKLSNASGAASEAFEKVAETDEQVSKLLQNNMDALKISMTDSFMPAITGMKKGMIGVLGTLNKMPNELKAFGGGMIFATSAAGKLMNMTVSLGRTLTALRQIKIAIKALKMGEYFGKQTSPIGKLKGSFEELDSKMKGMSRGAISLKGAIGAAGLGLAISFTTGEIIKLVGAIKEWQKAEEELQNTLEWADAQTKKQLAGLTEEQKGLVLRKTLLKDLANAYREQNDEEIANIKAKLISYGISEEHIKNEGALLQWRTHLEKVAIEQGAKFDKEHQKNVEKTAKLEDKQKQRLEHLIAQLKLYGEKFKSTGKGIDEDIKKAQEQLNKAEKKAAKERADFEKKIEKELADNKRKVELSKLKGTAEYYEKLKEYTEQDKIARIEALKEETYFITASKKEQQKMIDLINAEALMKEKNIERQKTAFLEEEAAKRAKIEYEHTQQVISFYNSLGETISEAIGRGLAGDKDAFKESLKQILVMTLDYLEKQYILAKADSIVKAILTSGGSLTKDAPLLIAGHLAIQAAKAAIGSFAEGAIIEKTGLAIVHKDEAIMNVNRMADVLSAVMSNRGTNVGFPDEFRIVMTDEDGIKLYEHAIKPAEQRYNRQFE